MENKPQFDENGRLILSDAQKRYTEEKRKINERPTIILNFLRSELDGTTSTCEFKLCVPRELEALKNNIYAARDWTNNAVKTTAQIDFEELADGYALIINGTGHDKRCEWCKSFRTALRTSLLDSKAAIIQKRACKFEDSESNEFLDAPDIPRCNICKKFLVDCICKQEYHDPNPERTKQIMDDKNYIFDEDVLLKCTVQTKSGLLVRSFGEKKIADFLYYQDIDYVYDNRRIFSKGWRL